jgi:DNA-binding MarR family transcriptional regulator
VHSALVGDLDAELRASHGLSLHEYEVLLVLADAPDERLRMSDLAAAVLLSQSGLTRLVDRLVREGSVERVRCEEDRRGHWAALTGAGGARFEAARVVHRAGVRARFLDRLEQADLEALAAAWERVVPGATAEEHG